MTTKKVRGATLAVAKSLPETCDVAGYEKLFAVDSFRDYGRFAGDGRKTTELEICGYNIKRGAARKIIDRFLTVGEQYSPSGLSAEIVANYCDDVGLAYVWEDATPYISESFVKLKTPIKQGEK